MAAGGTSKDAAAVALLPANVINAPKAKLFQLTVEKLRFFIYN